MGRAHGWNGARTRLEWGAHKAGMGAHWAGMGRTRLEWGAHKARMRGALGSNQKQFVRGPLGWMDGWMCVWMDVCVCVCECVCFNLHIPCCLFQCTNFLEHRQA